MIQKYLEKAKCFLEISRCIFGVSAQRPEDIEI
jgi:hypothetical protein